jgi:hypothetical protein
MTMMMSMSIPVHNSPRTVCRSIPTRCSKTVRWRKQSSIYFRPGKVIPRISFLNTPKIRHTVRLTMMWGIAIGYVPPFRANPPPVENPDYNSRTTSSRGTEKYNQAPDWTAFPNYRSRIFTGNFIHTQGKPKPAQILDYREHPHWQLRRHLGKPQPRKTTFTALKTREKVPPRHSTAIYIVWGTSQFMITELTTSTFRTHLRSDSTFLNPTSIYATKFHH